MHAGSQRLRQRGGSHLFTERKARSCAARRLEDACNGKSRKASEASFRVGGTTARHARKVKVAEDVAQGCGRRNALSIEFGNRMAEAQSRGSGGANGSSGKGAGANGRGGIELGFYGCALCFAP